MIFFEKAAASTDLHDDFVVFISQLRGAGINAVINKTQLPEGMSRSTQFDISPMLAPRDMGAGDHLVLLGADKIDAARAAAYRRLPENSVDGLTAIGPFPTLQSRISVRTRLSYVLYADPAIVDSSPWGGGLPVVSVNAGKGFRRSERSEVLLFSPPMDTADERAALQSWISTSQFSISILTTGKSKESWIADQGTATRIYHYSEMLPIEIAPMFDAVILFCPPKSSYRAKTLLANLSVSDVILIDCSLQHRTSLLDKRWISGPADVRSAYSWFAYEILPHAHLVRKEMSHLPKADVLDADAALMMMQIPSQRLRETSGPAQVTMMPTNGIGLGHAQRCSLVAGEIAKHNVAPVFAAFPSCMRMLQGYGFDVMPLVSRSPLHKQEHDNDALNRMRLRSLCAEQGTFVFDGGYVFDSVMRTIAEKRMRGIWIRRGMWQAGQSNAIALDREKIFHKVIVPSECFPELNESYSTGDHVETVGPVVQRVEMKSRNRTKLRKSLSAKFGDFDSLVVTMLGGGVAADRSQQLCAIAANLSGRPDVLHLVVTWPTATVPAALYGWGNTHVVKTHHASALVSVADLYISAVGYNSFHEAMYNKVPTIFMAQMNAFMDDQRTRAMAAVERGVADIVAPDEMSLLSHLITAHLDGTRGQEIRKAFSQIELPETGNAAAAKIIIGDVSS